MAKNSFILYHDQKEVIDELDDEQAGKLFKAIYEYNVNKKLTLTGALKLIFIPFKSSFDRNNDKWEDIVQKRSEAGKKGMKSRWENKEKITNDNKSYQMITNITDSVSVSDSVNVSVSESVNDNNITPPHTPTEIFDYCFTIFKNYLESDMKKSCEKMFNHYEANNWKNIYNWKKKAEEWIQDDIDSGKIKENKKEYDTRMIYTDRETGKDFQYDKEGNKHFL